MFDLLSFIWNGLLIVSAALIGVLLIYCIICIIILGPKFLKKAMAENEELED